MLFSSVLIAFSPKIEGVPPPKYSVQSDGIKVGTSEVAVDPKEPTGMMFDAMPSPTDGNGAGAPAASPEKPLVGSFSAPAGAMGDAAGISFGYFA